MQSRQRTSGPSGPVRSADAKELAGVAGREALEIARAAREGARRIRTQLASLEKAARPASANANGNGSRRPVEAERDPQTERLASAVLGRIEAVQRECERLAAKLLEIGSEPDVPSAGARLIAAQLNLAGFESEEIERRLIEMGVGPAAARTVLRER